MKTRLITLAAIAALAGHAHAGLLGERLNPANLTLSEDSATGVLSGSYLKADGSTATIDRVILLSGASASRLAIGAAVIEDNCDKTTLSVFWDSASGANYRAYACDMKAGNVINSTGTNQADGAPQSLLLIKRDAGGSAQGVNPIYTPAKIAFMQVGKVALADGTVNNNNCVRVNDASGAPATAALTQPSHTCGSTVNLYPDAGFSDVEPDLLQRSVNGGTGVARPSSVVPKAVFQQIYGVAVNLKFYRALQASQGLTLNDEPANRPNLSSTWVRSAITGKLGTTAASNRGFGIDSDSNTAALDLANPFAASRIVSESVDSAVKTKQVNICRRANGSGTQAGANIWFNGNPCNGASALGVSGANGVAQAVSGSTLSIVESSSAGNLENCLKTADNLAGNQGSVFDPAQMVNPAYASFAYAIGHLTRDNDPAAGTASDKQYRYVKLDGAQPEHLVDKTSGKCDGTRNFQGCNDAKTGRYAYVFESTCQWNTAAPNLVGQTAKVSGLSNLCTKGFTPAALQGNPDSVIAGLMALPGVGYSGSYGNLPVGDALVYGSRVSRSGNSCQPAILAR